MPRINRVRVHNVLYDKGNRVFDNLSLNLGGHDGLLILQNGGGKTLLLQLMAQTVIPNVSLQKRRLATLVAENSFTGHVLVEWLLDTDPPQYVLTGFCFAESLGSGNRELDYFMYLTEYSQRNPWDLDNFPLVGEDGRTLNYQQLRRLLRTAAGQVRTFSADRRQDYRRELKTFNIDPEEWEHVLTTNSSEGGVGKFFEACSKTPQLLDRLLIPALDSVLGRRQDETDALTQAFEQVAEELITLPELKANCHALGQLVERLPELSSALQEVETAQEQEAEAEQALAALLATLARGTGQLEAEDADLAETMKQTGNLIQGIQFKLASIIVEEKRRQLEQYERKLQAEETKVRTVQTEYQAAADKYRRCQARRLWELSQEKKARLREEQEQEQTMLKGREVQAEEIRELGTKLWPWHQGLTKDLKTKLETVTAELGRTEESQRASSEEKKNLIQERDHRRLEREKLRGQGEEFDLQRLEAAAKLTAAGWGEDLIRPEPAIAWVNAQQAQAETARHRAQTAYNTAQEKITALRTQMQQLKAQEGELGRELKQISQDYDSWKDELLSIRELLALIGMSRPDHAAEPYALKLPLLKYAEQLEADRTRLELERAQLKQRQVLLGADDGAICPNTDTAKLQAALTKQGLPTILGTAWLQQLNDDARREEYVARFPWLPYALIAEEEQLLRFMQRRPKIKEDLSAAVPLVARQTLNLSSELDIGLHFVQHQGLHLFVYPAQISEVLAAIAGQVQDLERQLGEVRGKSQHCRQAADKLTQLQRSFPYHTDEQWEAARKQATAAWQKTQDTGHRLAAEVEELERQQEKVKQAGEQARERLSAWSNLLTELDNYQRAWGRNQARAQQIARLNSQEAEINEKIVDLEIQEQRLAEQAAALRDRFQLLGTQWDQLRQDETELFAAHASGAIWSADTVAGPSHPIEWADYNNEASILRAKLKSLDREAADLADIRRRLQEYQADIKNLNQQIKDTGVAEEIIAGLPVVTEAEEQWWRERAQNLSGELQEAEALRNVAQSLVDKAAGAHEAERERILREYDRTPVQSPEIDLHEYRTELLTERQGVQADLNKLADQRGFIQELRRNYQIAQESLMASGVAETHVSPWDFSREQDKLRRSLKAPIQTVQSLLGKREQAKEQTATCSRRWLEAVEAMGTGLQVLANVHINHFFNQLKATSRQPGWEQQLDKVKASLTHVEAVIGRVQAEANRRLDDADRVLAEMVERAFRQADGILQQLQELQSSSRVRLRGANVALVKVDFTRPDPADGQERIKRYLEQVIAQAVEQKQTGTDEEVYRQGLAQAVRSSALVGQLVPLDRIRFRVLKPRSDEQPYTAGDYHSWDTLVNWSEGQRYAARFAVFVVLMYHLRQKLSPGQDSSVIIADNPFGGASSGHILEIVMAVAKQTKTQLFCVTAHRQTEIMREFNVLYSLVFRRTLSGQERLIPVDETAAAVCRTGIEPAWANVPGSPQGTDLGGQLRLLPF